MKIILKVFIVVVLIFNVSFAGTFSEDMYNEKVRQYQSLISQESTFRRMANRSSNKTYWLNLADRAKGYVKELENFKASYKKDPQKVTENLYKEQKSTLSNRIKLYSRQNSAYVRKLHTQYSNQLANLEKRYKDYQTALKAEQEALAKKSAETPTANKLKVSNLNTISNQANPAAASTGNVQLKAASLNTTTTINNVSVSEKAKANVGGVSIGVEEKK